MPWRGALYQGFRSLLPVALMEELQSDSSPARAVTWRTVQGYFSLLPKALMWEQQEVTQPNRSQARAIARGTVQGPIPALVDAADGGAAV